MLGSTSTELLDEIISSLNLGRRLLLQYICILRRLGFLLVPWRWTPSSVLNPEKWHDKLFDLSLTFRLNIFSRLWEIEEGTICVWLFNLFSCTIHLINWLTSILYLEFVVAANCDYMHLWQAQGLCALGFWFAGSLGLVPLVELNTPVVNESFGFSMPLLEAVNFFLGVGL